MKTTLEIIEKIEGEANLELDWKDGKIDFAKIKFLNFRGIENILSGKDPLDALVITPRVCGICCHSHVNAAVLALEDCYENLEIPQKAKIIRQIVLNSEKIQNHIKWFIHLILPALNEFDEKVLYSKEIASNAQKAFIKAIRLGAIFSGQWPHGAFNMIGGVTCDVTRGDIFEAKALLYEVEEYLQKEFFGISCDALCEIGLEKASSLKSLYGATIRALLNKNISNLGQSYDQFIALGELKKCVKTKIVNVDTKFVSENLENTFFQDDGYTYSKSAMYKNKYFETGPIARMMISKNPIIRDLHRRHKDSLSTRIIARLTEIAFLIKESRELLEKIDIKEASLIRPKFDINELSVTGVGIVEASRGSLIHQIDVKYGEIISYDIITPTVWNLGNGTKNKPSIAQKALIGVENMQKADFIFKSFDVCSVCTTQ